jgi:hypothetical protein
LVRLTAGLEQQPLCAFGAVIADELLAFEAPALMAQHLRAARVVVRTAVAVERILGAGFEEGALVPLDAVAALLVLLAVRAVGAEGRLALVVTAVTELLQLVPLAARPRELVLVLVQAVVTQLRAVLDVAAQVVQVAGADVRLCSCLDDEEPQGEEGHHPCAQLQMFRSSHGRQRAPRAGG